MTNIILTAGLATRLGPLAPHGCKALVPVAGRPIIEWQLDVLGDARIVCRSEHAPLLAKYGPTVTDDRAAGPLSALVAGLKQPVEGPVTVVYADTWFSALPFGDAWVGVQRALCDRWWDVYDPPVIYREPRPNEWATVCVGVYRFPDGWALATKAHWMLGCCWQQTMDWNRNKPGLSGLVNQFQLPPAVVDSWLDVGDPDALWLASTTVERAYGTVASMTESEGVIPKEPRA